MRDPQFTPKTYQDIVNEILVTCYLGTKNSSFETRDRAQRLAKGINSLHFDFDVDKACEAITGIFESATGKIPKF